MTIYILLALTLTFLCFFRNKKLTVFIAAILLIIIAGLRAESVGTDTVNYGNLFEWYGDDLFGSSHANEPGYALLQFMVVRLGLPYRAMVLIVQLLIIIMLSVYALTVSHRPQYVLLCYVLLYFYFYSFNTSRQYLSIPLLLFAYDLLDKGKIKGALLLFVAAGMFHNVALMGVIVLIFKKKRWTPSFQIVLLALTLVIGLTSLPQSLTQRLTGFMPSGFVDYVLDESEYRLQSFSLSRFMLTGFNMALVATLKNDSNKLCILTLGICLLNFFAFQPVIARMAQLFTIIQITIIPEIPYMIQEKARNFLPALKFSAYAYMMIVFLYMLSSNTAQVVPYNFGGWVF